MVNPKKRIWTLHELGTRQRCRRSQLVQSHATKYDNALATHYRTLKGQTYCSIDLSFDRDAIQCVAGCRIFILLINLLLGFSNCICRCKSFTYPLSLRLFSLYLNVWLVFYCCRECAKKLQFDGNGGSMCCCLRIEVCFIWQEWPWSSKQAEPAASWSLN